MANAKQDPAVEASASSELLLRFFREIEDATLLVEHAVANGKPVDDKLISATKEAQEFLRVPELPSAASRTFFETSYRDLVQALSPVTAATLRATTDEAERPSAARRWSRKLWVATIVFAMCALVAESYLGIVREFFARDEETTDADLFWHKLAFVISAVVPFLYGGLGASTYLLRAAHEYLHARSFDTNRTPEYLNRMLLGMVSGGAIQLFVAQVTDDKDAVVKLSAAALAFLAGYNCELLFNAIERISAALLPKVGLDSVRRAEPVQISGFSVRELLEALQKATTPEEKQAILGLIAKLEKRI